MTRTAGLSHAASSFFVTATTRQGSASVTLESVGKGKLAARKKFHDVSEEKKQRTSRLLSGGPVTLLGGYGTADSAPGSGACTIYGKILSIYLRQWFSGC